jgi:chemotaxis protein methyltransferase CheR
MSIEKKEFAFSRDDFNQVRQLLHKKAGIRLTDSKDSMVYSRLVRRLRSLNLPTFAKYLCYLQNHDEEEQHFISALTTNLTSFFREQHHFPVLQQYLLDNPGPKKIWCAASSTGEEPYSIAMTVADTYGGFDVPVEIIASDIDKKVLDTAKAGIYPVEKINNLTTEQRKRFLHNGKGSNKDKVRVVPELANMVQFKQINLTDAIWQIPDKIDIIFCRNVMIYFDKTTQLKILKKMVSLLPKNGIYVAGHSENFGAAEHLVKLLGKTVYRPVKR